MSHVTPELQIAILQGRIGALAARRNKIVERAREEIEQANKEFDREALPLNRQLTRLLNKIETSSPPVESRPRPRIPAKVYGLSPEEEAHYNRLRTQGKRHANSAHSAH